MFCQVEIAKDKPKRPAATEDILSYFQEWPNFRKWMFMVVIVINQLYVLF